MDIHIEVVTINEQMMTLLVVREGVMDWILTPIYASPKSSFWNVFCGGIFRSLGPHIEAPWLVVGDTNQ